MSLSSKIDLKLGLVFALAVVVTTQVILHTSNAKPESKSENKIDSKIETKTETKSSVKSTEASSATILAPVIQSGPMQMRVKMSQKDARILCKQEGKMANKKELKDCILDKMGSVRR